MPKIPGSPTASRPQRRAREVQMISHSQRKAFATSGPTCGNVSLGAGGPMGGMVGKYADENNLRNTQPPTEASERSRRWTAAEVCVISPRRPALMSWLRRRPLRVQMGLSMKPQQTHTQKNSCILPARSRDVCVDVVKRTMALVISQRHTATLLSTHDPPRGCRMALYQYDWKCFTYTLVSQEP